MLIPGVLVAKLLGLWLATTKVLSQKISQSHAGRRLPTEDGEL